MIKNNPENKSQNSCDCQKHKQIETAVPYTFLKPQWPKSETHERQNNYNKKNEPECLILCFVGLIFNNHINTFVSHWILRLIWHNIFWKLHLVLTYNSRISFDFNHIFAKHHKLAKFNAIFNCVELSYLFIFYKGRDHFYDIITMSQNCNMEIDTSDILN